MEEEKFMLEAIKDAKKYGLHYGAVVVKDSKIIAKAGKSPPGDARFHAETKAILKATKKLNSKYLEGCTLYSTCEPCPMCFYMAWITHVPEIVYGATLKDSIAFGSEEIDIEIDELNEKSGNKISIKKEFLRDQCLDLFKQTI